MNQRQAEFFAAYQAVLDAILNSAPEVEIERLTALMNEASDKLELE
jgi:hypothetical protein